jgi:hypothetical protein
MNCALCQVEPREENSHVIPSFVFRWLKKTSPTGFMRGTENINQRIQDGVKYPLLCKKCEDDFSVWETAFANKIFFPLMESSQVENRGNQKPIFYDGFLLPFCVSVLWRALHFLWIDNSNQNESLPAEFESHLKPTYDQWQQFLLGKSPHPGKFEVHLFPLDLIESGRLPDNPGSINTYLVRGIDMDIVYNRVRGHVYIKLPYMIILGRIFDLEPKFGECSRIRLRKGMVGYKNYKITADIWNYMLSRARLIEEKFRTISPQQAAKIDEALSQNPERSEASSTFEANIRDFILKNKSERFL